MLDVGSRRDWRRQQVGRGSVWAAILLEAGAHANTQSSSFIIMVGAPLSITSYTFLSSCSCALLPHHRDHVPDVRALLRSLERKTRQKQGIEEPTETELALAQAMDIMDQVVRLKQPWEGCLHSLAEAFGRAAMPETAQLVLDVR